MKDINYWPLLLAAIAFAVAIGLAATQSRDSFAIFSFELTGDGQAHPPPVGTPNGRQDGEDVGALALG